MQHRSIVARMERQRNAGTSEQSATSLPDFASLHPGYGAADLFTIKKYADSEIELDFTVSVTMLHPIPIHR